MKTFAEAEIFFFLSLQSKPPSPYSFHYTPLPPPVFSFPHGELRRRDLKLDDTSQIAACQDAITCKFQFAGSNRSACGGCAEWRGCCGGMGCAVFSPLCAWQSPGWPETSSYAGAFIWVAIRPAQHEFRMRTDMWKGKLCVWSLVCSAAALGSQAYCVLLKLYFTVLKVYFTEQRIKEVQRVEPILYFIIYLKNLSFYCEWKWDWQLRNKSVKKKKS